MGYVERVLQPGEELRYKSRIHWLIYLPRHRPARDRGGGVLGGDGATRRPTCPPLAIAVVAGLIALWGLVLLLGAWIRRWTTELAVTSRRIIYKRGLIRRYSIEMNMDKVESVDVSQSILGRIFDFGDIFVRGTGSGLEPLHQIDSPLEFRNHVTAE